MVDIEMGFPTSQYHSQQMQLRTMQINGLRRDRGVTPQTGPTSGPRASGLPMGFGADVPKGAPKAEQGLLRFVSPSWITGTLLMARCCTGRFTL